MSSSGATAPRAGALCLAVCLAALIGTAAPARAHGGNGDYRVEITGFEGDASGIDLRVVDLGDQLDLRRSGAASVTVLGYELEPYLRLDDDGVCVNLNSPATYLNRERYVTVTVPDRADAAAEPDWSCSAGDSARWHDHRIHWMSSTPRADVLADPDVERVIFDANRVELTVDERSVVAVVRVTWLPPPERIAWLAVGVGLAAVIGAALTLWRRSAPWLPLVGIVAAAAGVAVQGTSGARIGAGIAAAVVAIAAVALRRPGVAGVSSLAVVALCATRLDILEHRLVSGFVDGAGQRVAWVVAIGAAGGVVVATMVDMLGPTRTEPRDVR